MFKYAVPAEEIALRITRVQAELRLRRLEALLAFGTECEPQDVRYLSDFVPSFETAGVLVPVSGPAFLLTGPECELAAQDKSPIKNIRPCFEFRFSGAPEYGQATHTLENVLREASNGQGFARIQGSPGTITSPI